MQGFINSRTSFSDVKGSGYELTKRMIWPFQYNIGLTTKDPNVSLINYLPKNKIETTDVGQTLGYNIGGNFQSAPSIGGNGSFNYSKTISYTQKSYVSEVDKQNSKSVKWGVKANEFVTPDGKNLRMIDIYSYKVQMVRQVQQENILLLIINCHL